MKRIEPAAKPQVWPLTKIIPYPNNPRTHPDSQIELLATLMQKHGVDQPIVVDEHGFILKGHGRRLAAVKAGFEEFPVVIHRGLSENDKRAIRLADNQVALLSGWNEELLRVELNDLSKAGYDMPLLGFDNVQLVSFMANVPTGNPEAPVPEPPANPVSRAGDLWVLGKHRILCGDSTNEKEVERLMEEGEPLLMVTDPPYGVDYDPAWRYQLDDIKRSTGKVKNDDRSDWRKAWALFEGDVAYVWSSDLHLRESIESLESAGFQLRAQIIWAKEHFVIGRGDYHFQHEPCCYAVRKGRKGHWSGDRKQATVWQIDNSAFQGGTQGEENTATQHGAQKPVECMRRPIQNNSQPGASVYDPFLGSGTTLIAADLLNRFCLGIELNPAYVDVAIERWQTFAKAEAKLDGDGRTYAEITKARKKAPVRKTGAKVSASRPSGAQKSSKPIRRQAAE
jgi:DNA modification methylase